jgi:cell division protein FtsB
MKFFRSWTKRIATALGVVLLLVLVVDFNSRMVHLLELRGEMEVEQSRLDELLAEEEALKLEIAYAESDEAIAEWAREQNWMGHEGDIVVVPIPDGSYVVEEEIPEAEPQEFLSNWEAWWLWLTYRE